jgi:hypothetical protein
MRHQRTFLIFWLTLILAGCNLATAPDLTPTILPAPNVRLVELVTPSFAPTPARELQPIVSPTATATLPPTATQFVCTPSNTRTQHAVIATLDYAAKTVQVAQQIRYHNHSADPLNELVLNVEPNQREGVFRLETIQVNQSDVTNTELRLNGLRIPLAQPLLPHCEITVQLRFTLTLPKVSMGISALRGYFGYGERQINLAYWLPTIAPYLNRQWLVHEPQAIGEQIVLEQADWDVTLTVNNASGDLKIAAPGTVEKLQPNQWRYVFNAARDFAMSLSEYVRVQTVTTAGGVVVEVYSFPDAVRSVASGLQDGGLHALEEGANALQQFSDLFGPYPYTRLLIVQGDFPDGMEFSGLVFVSTNWFYSYEGGADNYLTVITVHEVSHQWWYARVGNDAALAPWLDEALATYSEYIYYEEYHPELKLWWWDFRVGWYNPQGNVDSTVYEFDNARAYINAVYLRGVQMLHNLREDLGTEAFFRLMAAYVQSSDGKIATPELFWALLSPEQYAASQATRDKFLRDPLIFGDR